MAGGRGTRFWPLSRTDRPKQLLKLFGERTLIEETIERIAPVVPRENIYIITGTHLLKAVRSATRRMLPAGNVIAEPVARNTSPAIALTMAAIMRRNRRGVACVLPSDHTITEPVRFRRVIETAYRIAKKEKRGLVTFGIKPAYPETGYGYVERGERLAGAGLKAPAFSVRAFKEKPDKATAERFVQAGKFYWNSGMFVWSVEAYAGNLKQLDPALLQMVEDVATAPAGSKREMAAVARMFKEAEATSIDYALMEKAKQVFVVEADIGWNDIGSWLSLDGLLPKAGGDISYNCTLVAHSSSNSLAFSPGKVVALLGVSDLIVVDTPDALLVCHRDRTQDVKKIVEELQSRGMRRHL